MISITRDSITLCDVDAIVNAAKPSLLGGGGVDGYIHSQAGPGLLIACQQIAVVGSLPTHRCTACTWQGEPQEEMSGDYTALNLCPNCGEEAQRAPSVSLRGAEAAKNSTDIRCPTGEARITPGFDLVARMVIHTVGPVYWHHLPEEAERLLAAAYRNSCQLAVDCGLSTIAFPAISCGVYRFPIPEAARIAVAAVSDFVDRLDIVFCLFDEACYRAWSVILDPPVEIDLDQGP